MHSYRSSHGAAVSWRQASAPIVAATLKPRKAWAARANDSDAVRLYGQRALSAGLISATPGDAAAEGIAALILTGDTITAVVGDASATGVSAALRLAIAASVGNASATGVKALIDGYTPPVTPKPIRKTQYIPTGSVPGDVAGIQRFLQLEFERLNNGLESPFTHDSYEVLHVEPGKKQADRVYLVFADGTDWDPGSGRGFYYYDSGTWTFLG